jgi:hypothetical protein
LGLESAEPGMSLPLSIDPQADRPTPMPAIQAAIATTRSFFIEIIMTDSFPAVIGRTFPLRAARFGLLRIDTTRSALPQTITTGGLERMFKTGNFIV